MIFFVDLFCPGEVIIHVVYVVNEMYTPQGTISYV